MVVRFRITPPNSYNDMYFTCDNRKEHINIVRLDALEEIQNTSYYIFISKFNLLNKKFASRMHRRFS